MAIQFLALAGFYFVAGRLGLGLAFIDSSISPVWPATGVAIAGLVILGGRFWPAIFLGAWAYNYLQTSNLLLSLVMGAGNALEGLAGAFIVRRYANGLNAFSSVRTLIWFVLGAGLAAPLLSATVGVTSLAASGSVAWQEFGALWVTWWMGDVGGALVFAPLIILWAHFLLGPRPHKLVAEEGWSVIAAAAVAGLVFLAPWPSGRALDLALVLLLPVLIWPAYRLGPRAAASVVVVVDLIAIFATTQGRGPLVLTTSNESFLLLQVFVSILSIVMLALGAHRGVDPEGRPVSAGQGQGDGAANQRVHASPGLILFAIALLPLLLMTASAGAAARNLESGLAEARFEQHEAFIVNRIEDLLRRHSDRLYGAKGLFESSVEVTRGEFRTFVNVTAWQTELIGLQGVAFLRYVEAADLPAFEQRVRNDTSVRPDGYPDFRVHPVSNRTEFFVVEYFEPLAGNEAAFGLDIGFEENRRAAVERAVAYDMVAATRSLTLVQEVGSQRGILVILPVYQGGDPGTSEGRRERLLGLVDTVHRLGDMMGALQTDIERELGPVSFELYEGEPDSNSPVSYDMNGLTKLYDTDGTSFGPERFASRQAALVPLEVFGQPWTLAIGRPKGLIAPVEAGAPWFLTGVGAVLTLSLVAFSYHQQEILRRRNLVAALDQSQQINEFKTQLLNVASHELNTPISALRLQLYLLRDRLGATMDADTAKSFAMLNRNVDRLATLVGDTLDVARIQSGRLQVQAETMELGQALAEANEMFQPLAAKGEIRLEGDWPKPLTVHADGKRILQVVYNLLSNAIKFSPKGGVVTLRAAPQDGEVRVAVQDQGPGLTSDQISRLFKPFSQVHDPTMRNVKGTGLGLYISRAIIEQHGGKLWVESEGPGRGSTFVFTLPVRPEIGSAPAERGGG